MAYEQASLPVIDISALVSKESDDDHKQETALKIHKACRDWGFFYVKNHGVPIKLQEKLMELSRLFFEQSLESKMQIAMNKGGRAWRGYFPVGDELTSGKPDGKEGLYFGTEIDDDNHPKIINKAPLHGRNQFPSIGDNTNEFRHVILTYMSAMESLGRSIMSGLARSLKLDPDFLDEPTCLFRIFNYPACFCQQPRNEELWGVGEHTDYGMLTILLQDNIGGLQVKIGQDK